MSRLNRIPVALCSPSAPTLPTLSVDDAAKGILAALGGGGKRALTAIQVPELSEALAAYLRYLGAPDPGEKTVHLTWPERGQKGQTAPVGSEGFPRGEEGRTAGLLF